MTSVKVYRSKDHSKLVTELTPREVRQFYAFPQPVYKCKLSQELQGIAFSQLHEDPLTRDGLLSDLRFWIQASNKISNCRLDANFLLRFLRHRRFVINSTRATLVEYATLNSLKAISTNSLGIEDPRIMEIIRSGAVFPLPKCHRDKAGRRVIFSIVDSIDPLKQSTDLLAQALLLCFESLLEDEENQVQGVACIIDARGVNLSRFRMLHKASCISQTIELAMPIRLKQVDVYGLPSILHYVYQFGVSLLSPALQKRVGCHTYEKLMDDNVNILPREYGGVVSMKDMLQEYIEDLERKHSRIGALRKIKLTTSNDDKENDGMWSKFKAKFKNSLNVI